MRKSSNTAGSALVELVLPLASFRQRADVAHFLGIADRVGDELAFDQPVDQAAIERLLGADRIAGRAHFERLLHPATRGSRCVPPAPGSRPSFTSGVPSFADGTATR